MFARTGWTATGSMLVLVAMTVLLAAWPAVAASPSELLQKAIYTEETVGNLDEAMKLYVQVIADGQAGQDAAAQAQYRLALCYQKKGRDADAKAAFEALIENYPNAKDLVAQARKHLPSALKLLPAPWVLGEQLQINMKLPTGLDIGTMIYMVDAAKHDGKDVTRCSTRGLVTVSDASSYSEVFCETGSFQPLTSHWKHSLLGEANAIYGDTSVEITALGNNKPFTIDFTPPAFDNEQCAELFRRLPLAVGYKTTLTVVTSLGGSKIELPINVTAKESIAVPAGTFECYKLELGVVNQTFWISADEHRYIVRFAAGGVSAELAKISQAEPGTPQSVSGESFSLTLPAGWLSYAPATSFKKEKGSRVYLLDPRADARAELVVRPKQTLEEDERGSTKVWTESFIADMKKVRTDFAVREPALSETTVHGDLETTMIADFTRDGKKMSMIGVAIIGETSAATMNLTTASEKLDELQPDFEALVESFELK